MELLHNLMGDNLGTLLNIIITVLAFFGIFKYVQGFLKALKEGFDVVEVVDVFFEKVEKYTEDKDLSKEEIADLVKCTGDFKKEWGEAKQAFKNLFKKKG